MEKIFKTLKIHWLCIYTSKYTILALFLFFLNLNLAADILPEEVTDKTDLNIPIVKINSSAFDGCTVKILSTSKTISKNPSSYKSEPLYVNSNVNNSYLKVRVTKVDLLERGIRLSLKVLWNIVKNDRQTEDWIGCYLSGLNEMFFCIFIVDILCNISVRTRQVAYI